MNSGASRLSTTSDNLPKQLANSGRRTLGQLITGADLAPLYLL